MKFGFLFGAGAEIGYGMPSGGEFALGIFRHDAGESKEKFNSMRKKVDMTTTYASNWLPKDFDEKSIFSFGKSVFQKIIKDTLEHNREKIIDVINDFDKIAKKNAKKLKDSKNSIDIDKILEDNLGTSIDNIHMNQKVYFIDEFKDGNKLFESSYFSALLSIYKNKEFFSADEKGESERTELGQILLYIIQLHIGALSKNLATRINNGVFGKRDDEFDFFDDIGEIIQLNYTSSGLNGMEYVLEKRSKDNVKSDSEKILQFAQNIIEELYTVVLSYKSLIDSNWHYLYNPKSDWAKFCKICIFLLNTQKYILETAKSEEISSKENGYYHMLKKAMDDKLFEISAIATTNYSTLIKEIIESKIVFLNGSTELWYDPYINKIGTEEELSGREKHVLVPLMFTQSGTKPITSVQMLIEYADTYEKWRSSDAIVIVGFGFGADDEHINGIVRTLIDSDNKKIIIVTLDNGQNEEDLIKEYQHKLKISTNNIKLVLVDSKGNVVGKDISWIDELCKEGK